MGTLKDIKYGARMLFKSRGFTAAAVIALALGIGATTAIFSVVNTVLLRPLPYKDADDLMVVRETWLPQFPEFSIAPGNFIEWQKQNTVFERLEAVRLTSYNLTGIGEPERVRAARVTGGLFGMLGARPQLGRDFLAEEDQPGHEFVAAISHGLWQRKFGADPGVEGQSLTLNGQSYTIIAVMPASFAFPDREVDVWTPVAFTAQQAQQHGAHYVSAYGRLRQGVTLAQAQAEMSAVAARLAETYPGTNTGWDVKVMPMQDYQVRDVKPALLFLLYGVILVLLIACANVANLLLARATGREKEMAIRTAMGAGRWRIVRQLLTESLLLSVIGGAAGVLVAAWGVGGLLSLAPEGLPRVKDVAIDRGAMLFAVAVTFTTGLLFGLVPALQASKPNLNETLKEGGRGGSGGPRRQRLRAVLVVTEVAIALVLLVGAGLLFRSFMRLRQVDPGFNPDNAVAAVISLPQNKYRDNAAGRAFFDQAVENFSHLPGVHSVGAANQFPMLTDTLYGFHIVGRPKEAPGAGMSTSYFSVTPDYFNAMGIKLLRGRLITDHDRENAPAVAVINETMAKRIFPDEEPIGHRISVDTEDEKGSEIVGIVSDVKQYGLSEQTPLQTYVPFDQQPFPTMIAVVRTEGDPAAVGAALRAAVFAVDKDQPISRIVTLKELVSGSVATRRFAMLLFVIFAAVALVLASVGLYGVMSYTVTQRTHEIGIRMALGAQSRDVLGLVLRQGVTLALIGIAIGLGLAFAATKLAESFLSSLLFQVRATDAVTFSAIPLVLLGVALVACFVPARRAMKTDPMIALRYE